VNVQLERGATAVLVLDTQELFASPSGPFENRAMDPTIAAINELTAAARTAGVPVVFSNYALRDDLRDAGLLAAMPFAADMRRSAPLIGLDPRVRREPSDTEVWHNRPSAFFRSELEHVLGALGVRTLVLAGVSVNNAIAATARDAFARDIPCLVPREAVGAAPFEPADELDAYFRALDTWTAEVAPLADVVARLGA
jgi:nicotinamidase-related amidase